MTLHKKFKKFDKQQINYELFLKRKTLKNKTTEISTYKLN